MASKKSVAKTLEHAPGCMTGKLVFGLLVLLVGLYGVAGDMGWLGAKAPVSPWWLLVVLFGLVIVMKATSCQKCPVCRAR